MYSCRTKVFKASFWFLSLVSLALIIWKANQLVVFPSAPGLPTAMESWSRIEVGAGIDDVVGALQLHVCDKNFKWKSLRSPLDKWFKLSRYVWKMFKTEPGPQTKLRSQWRRHARIGAMLFCPLCMPNGKWQGVANGAESIRWRHAQIAAGLASWRRSGRVPISMGSSASASEFHHRLAQKEATNQREDNTYISPLYKKIMI